MKNKFIISQIITGLCFIIYMVIILNFFEFSNSVRNFSILLVAILLTSSFTYTCYLGAKKFEAKGKIASVYRIMFGAGFFFGLIIVSMYKYMQF